jgi:Zn-dependent M28 family amino/carboxypeptidase
MVGAHYDHLGHSCPTSDPSDTICNGATDNAAGDAAVLAIGRAIANDRTPPRRSVILALWDEEEDGLLGSIYYTRHPLIPLARTDAYVNFDIQGANLRPSLRNDTFAVGADSGGLPLQAMVEKAYRASTLDGTLFSAIFGEGRSDYASFLGVQVPTVFFSDSTGPCYHTAQDDIGVVDFNKLDRQIDVALAVTRKLASSSLTPTFVAGTPAATYQDAVALSKLGMQLQADNSLFVAADRAALRKLRSDVRAIVAAGPGAFDEDAIVTLLTDAASAVSILTHGACDGFFGPVPGVR